MTFILKCVCKLFTNIQSDSRMNSFKLSDPSMNTGLLIRFYGCRISFLENTSEKSTVDDLKLHCALAATSGKRVTKNVCVAKGKRFLSISIQRFSVGKDVTLECKIHH